MEKKKRFLFIVLLLFLLIGLVILLLFRCGDSEEITDTLLPIDESAQEWNGNQNLPNGNESNKKIEIPGFKSLVFAANQKNQKVNFYNPKSNECLFFMTLFVEDEELWKSGYVQPNNGYYDIELNKTLETGNYKAYLLIECYKENGKALNSAKIDFDLSVK